MAECMYLGKPVIATDWSATSEYLDANNGLPVQFSLVKLAETHGPYFERLHLGRARHRPRGAADAARARRAGNGREARRGRARLDRGPVLPRPSSAPVTSAVWRRSPASSLGSGRPGSASRTRRREGDRGRIPPRDRKRANVTSRSQGGRMQAVDNQWPYNRFRSITHLRTKPFCSIERTYDVSCNRRTITIGPAHPMKFHSLSRLPAAIVALASLCICSATARAEDDAAVINRKANLDNNGATGTGSSTTTVTKGAASTKGSWTNAAGGKGTWQAQRNWNKSTQSGTFSGSAIPDQMAPHPPGREPRRGQRPALSRPVAPSLWRMASRRPSSPPTRGSPPAVV